ncbi:MAG: toxic anion resistance protein, partial [Eubacteriales bacterium]|nr:toxic anion resistance protein [Eubacteriales bacterium]
MNENKETPYVPSLTLNPNEQAAAVEAAPAPTLTIGEEAPVEVAEEVKEEIQPEKLELERLSPEEQAAVQEFSKQIDVRDTNLVLSYGAAAQKNIAGFSEQALSKVRTKDLGSVGNMLSDLVVQLEGLDTEEEKRGLFGRVKKVSRSIEELKARYSKAEVNVDKITALLQQHQVTLGKDIATMDKMYEYNLSYLKELTMYIIAGKLRVAELRETELPELQKKAQESGRPEDAQDANDFANMIGRFEKKLHDLELTRMISVQMSPQIRLIQNNDLLMSEKIQSTIVNTIPLWKSQMVLALSLHHSKQAMEATHEVS